RRPSGRGLAPTLRQRRRERGRHDDAGLWRVRSERNREVGQHHPGTKYSCQQLNMVGSHVPMPGIEVSLGGSYIDPELLRHLEDVRRLQRKLTLEGYSGPRLRRLVSDWGAASIARRPPSIEVQDATVPGP